MGSYHWECQKIDAKHLSNREPPRLPRPRQLRRQEDQQFVSFLRCQVHRFALGRTTRNHWRGNLRSRCGMYKEVLPFGREAAVLSFLGNQSVEHLASLLSVSLQIGEEPIRRAAAEKGIAAHAACQLLEVLFS